MPNVVVPQLGEGIEKAVVSFWHLKEGQEVKENADLVELSTDKASFNVPSPAAGVLKEILKQEGEEVGIGEVLAVIS